MSAPVRPITRAQTSFPATGGPMFKLTLIAFGAAVALHGDQAKHAVNGLLSALGAQVL